LERHKVLPLNDNGSTPTQGPRLEISDVRKTGFLNPPHEESEERLSVFRVFEIPSLSPRAISKLFPLDSQHLLLFAGSWHGDCIRRLCVRINKQRLLQKQLEKHNAT